MRCALLVALLVLPGAVAAQSAPCVGANFARPLPGATAVERRSADVPSARYPGIWQEGRVAGYLYQLSGDISGLLAPTREAPDWQVAILCDPAEGRCEQSARGAVPEAALPVAEALGRCLLGASVTAEDFGPGADTARQGLPADAGVAGGDRPLDSSAGLATGAGVEGARQDPPEGVAGPVDAGDGTDRPSAVTAREGAMPSASPSGFNPTLRPPETCGLDAIDTVGSPVRTMQRLLVSGGYDPGPVDGLMGARTRRALIAALGEGAGELAPAAAVDALDAALCGE